MEVMWGHPVVRERILEVMEALLTKAPTMELLCSWMDNEGEELQHFCIDHARLPWMTGISIIEISQYAVEEAFANANITAGGVV